MKNIISLIGFIFVLNLSFAQSYSSWFLTKEGFNKNLQKVTNSCVFIEHLNVRFQIYKYSGKYFWIETKHEKSKCKVKNNPYHGCASYFKSNCIYWRRKYVSKDKILKCN